MMKYKVKVPVLTLIFKSVLCIYCLCAGGIEMAACSHLKRVNVHVYERSTYNSYKRISCFDCEKGARATVHVLYCGGVHYDALVP